jgi:ATP-dependent RNA helicase RhlE
VSFKELGLSERTLKSLDLAGFENPTPIQARAIPPAMLGKDVIGCAATGTGKTAAFLLPMIERLTKGPRMGGTRGPRALILAPTRELALQIGEEAERFGGGQVRSAVVIGGVGMSPQADAFKKNVEIIVATPGRLKDHLDRRTAYLESVEMLVLDEADRMLDMGFRPQLDYIVARLPLKQKQTMLFSATMAGEVAEFAHKHLKDPVKVEVARSGDTAARATQQVFLVGHEDKLALLCALLAADDNSTLVFTRTKRRADRVAKGLQAAGLKVAVIHADRSQGQRRMALEGFKDGTYRVLVATDIAARGIDVEAIGHVINFDLPNVPEDYVHRIGRTARNQLSGMASSFAAPDETSLLRDIEKLTRTQVPRSIVPRDDEAFLSAIQKSPRLSAPKPRDQDSRPAGRRGGARRPQGGGNDGHTGGPRRSSGGQLARSSGAGRPPPRSETARPSGGNTHAPSGGSSAGATGGAATPKRLGSWRPKTRR